MFKIIFYSDSRGRKPAKEYIQKLNDKNDKDSHIKSKKIYYCFQALYEYGPEIGEPYVKHITGQIWELRPLRDRFFFFYWKDSKLVILHHFQKKTQRTPKREIEQAIRNMKDFIERNDKIGE